jgi:hypothetical protein
MVSPLRFVDAPFHLFSIFADCNALTLAFFGFWVGVGGHHSAVARCIGDTPNSRSCGIVWFVDILSVYCRSCLPNELGVRDWNWFIWSVGGILIDVFSFFSR